MKNIPSLTKASELFEAMGNCTKVAVLGTKLNRDSQFGLRRFWVGQIVSMRPESKGGLHWLVELKRRCVLGCHNNCSACKVDLFVCCEK